ncbi:MAG: 6-bladed beta-propeller [Gemmatimonas sp.]
MPLVVNFSMCLIRRQNHGGHLPCIRSYRYRGILGLLALSPLIVTASCANRDKTTSDLTRREVESAQSVSDKNQTPAIAGAAIPIVAVRDLVINPTEPGWELTNVSQIIGRDDGGIYALDPYDQNVRVFGPNGELVRRLGRKGSGPGEFTNAVGMSFVHDSLFVFESSNNRVTTFANNGGAPETRTVLLNPPGGGHLRSRTESGFLFSIDGSDELGNSSNGSAGLVKSSAYVSTNDHGAKISLLLAGITTAPLLRYDIGVEHVKNSKYGKVVSVQPLIQTSKTDVYPDGSGLLLATVQSNGGLGGSSIKLVRINLHGDSMWSRSLPVATFPVTDRQMGQLVDYLAAADMFKGVAYAGDKQMIADSLRREKFWPPLRDIRIARDNSIWITLGGPPWEAVRYWRLSSTGVFQSIVELPARFRLLWADSDHVWGTRTTENFELTIERYRLPSKDADQGRP